MSRPQIISSLNIPKSQLVVRPRKTVKQSRIVSLKVCTLVCIKNVQLVFLPAGMNTFCSVLTAVLYAVGTDSAGTLTT